MACRNKIGIHQFHSGSAVADAVTNCMFFVQSMLRNFGFQSEIFVEYLDPALSGRMRQLADLQIAEQDLLLIHHSMGHDIFSRLADLRCRKVLVYHNITPPQFFDEADPFHSYAIKGYSQLSLFRDIVESAIAVSPFNARQLRRRDFDKVAVIPFLKDFAAVRDAPHAKQPYYDEAAVFRLLFVGRIVPHKCQHELIDFVNRARSLGCVPLELVLVGHSDAADRYKLRLDEQVRRSGLDRHVKIIGRVSDEELFGWYRAASAYVSLSEHEGFGVPLIEAMAFDLPVVAYAPAGVPDTLGGAGITISDKNPASLLEPLTRLYRDRSFRSEVIRCQRRRLLRFSRGRIEAELRDWLTEVGVCQGDTDAFARTARKPRHEPITSLKGRSRPPTASRSSIEISRSRSIKAKLAPPISRLRTARKPMRSMRSLPPSCPAKFASSSDLPLLPRSGSSRSATPTRRGRMGCSAI
jgi:glycosyltransferase involved in cell wall biosynthesis